MNHEQTRKIQNYTALTLSGLAALFGLFWLVFILSDVLTNGISALRPGLFFNDSAPAGVTGGGLRHAPCHLQHGHAPDLAFGYQASAAYGAAFTVARQHMYCVFIQPIPFQ